MKKKVFYYAPQKNDTTSWWRIGAVLPYVKSDDFELIDISYLTNFSWEIFVPCDVFIFQRPFADKHVELMILVKDMGIKIITDFDDLLTAVPMYNPTYGQYLQSKAHVMKCVELSDEVWVSTKEIKDGYNEELRKKAIAFGSDPKGNYDHPSIQIIPNALNDYLFPIKNKKQFNPSAKKAIYRGGLSHEADVYSMGEELIKIINHKTDWTFTFIGQIYTYMAQRCGDNYQMIGGMTIMQYFKFLNTENPQVVFFPLEDNSFNRAKSNICWIEATFSGAAFLGNIALPEYIDGTVLDIREMDEVMGDIELLDFYNRVSWDYIKDNLLLSKVNKLRVKRLLHAIA